MYIVISGIEFVLPLPPSLHDISNLTTLHHHEHSSDEKELQDLFSIYSDIMDVIFHIRLIFNIHVNLLMRRVLHNPLLMDILVLKRYYKYARCVCIN